MISTSLSAFLGRQSTRLSRLAFGLLSALGVGAFIGCAYHMGDSGREVPGGYRTVAVPVFKNRTQEAGIEVYFTDSLVREFERGRIGKVTSKEGAQTTLEGAIDSVSYVVSSQVEAGKSGGEFLPTEIASGGTAAGRQGITTVLTTEYRIHLQTTLVLRRNSDQKVLWSGTFNGERAYLAPKVGLASLNASNAVYNQSARYQNIQAMAADLMSEAHIRLTENF